MNLSSKSLITTLFVIIVVVLGYFAIYPRYQAYVEARTAKATAQTQQDNLKVAQKQLSDFLADYKTHEDSAARLNETLPLSQAQMADILNDMDNLTKSTGMTLGQFTTQSTPGSDQLGATPQSIQPVELVLSTTGSFVQFKNFLTRLESNLRIMDITSISIQQSDNSGDLSFSMNFKTYYQQ